uniref:Uncharacterized protein n=1 Tax=Labrus bergylta TaxID=56723 RepID=A0A3Q3FEE8_9LABR
MDMHTKCLMFVSNLIFGFIMTGVEKMLEVDFACPCNPTWNGAFVAPFFLLPACTASSLMLLIHGCSGYESVLCSFLPPIVWLALMFLDGQYLVCAMTGWPGTFVTAQNTYLKWCKPINAANHATMLNQSHRFYILSQFDVLSFIQPLFILERSLRANPHLQ